MTYVRGSKLRGYTLTTDFTSAGQSLWAYGQKGRTSYFIKQFLWPVYPIEGSHLSDDDRHYYREKCREFENRHTSIMNSLRTKTVEGGNLVIAHEFFREDAHYFKVTQLVEASAVDYRSLTLQQTMLLMKTVAHSVRLLHSCNVVHGDLKMDNILLKRSPSGSFVAKLIDFDDCYLIGAPPPPEDCIVDFVYCSPETGQYIDGNVGKGDQLSAKSDIFALGLIFSQLLTGNLPDFDAKKYGYPYVAVSAGCNLRVEGSKIPDWLLEVTNEMLVRRPEDRPTIEEVFVALTSEQIIQRGTVMKGDLAQSAAGMGRSLKGTALSKKQAGS
jgi:serine/threonine protein kinase